jgi:hypothetical protein
MEREEGRENALQNTFWWWDSNSRPEYKTIASQYGETIVHWFFNNAVWTEQFTLREVKWEEVVNGQVSEDLKGGDSELFGCFVSSFASNSEENQEKPQSG